MIISTKGDPFSLNFTDFFGVGLALFSTILWSLYWILNTKSKADATVGLFSNFLVGTIFIGLYVLFVGGINLPNFQATLGVIYIGFF